MTTMRKLNTKSTAVAATCLIGSIQTCPSDAFPSSSTAPRCNAAFLTHHNSVRTFQRHCHASKSHLFCQTKRHQPSLYMSDSDDNQDDLRRNASVTDLEAEEDDEDFGFMNLDEADELFFNSMMRKDDDDFIDTKNADDLMQLLQEMVDSNRAAEIDDEEFAEMDEATLMEILGYDSDDEDEETTSNDVTDRSAILNNINESNQSTRDAKYRGMRDLEHALMQGVVPADAGVGSGILPGDIGFDPLELSTKDYFKQVQTFILNMLPERKIRMDENSEREENTGGAAMPIQGFVGEEERPPALILRDYREAEIRHGRLAMLAAAIWPLQEIIDRIFMPEKFGDFTVIYGGETLPFLPLLMTFMMLNLGYLDIYSSEIKENESGDAFLPGECL